ncbi:hypothetical protein HJC23_004640 [Cyclotella cryptica]|uniref:HPP transmembrane region domain-containing protein n=1 Tax=Cyclotella cryptica TaxID=29204 RepID=A0ABD3QEU5_9STRA|eukprot:CCRYP_005964-RA/>CCRYP_005964-RA protein AED:0.02 eAED:0.02 QI:263/1/1/1/1/1/2/741/564
MSTCQKSNHDNHPIHHANNHDHNEPSPSHPPPPPPSSPYLFRRDQDLLLHSLQDAGLHAYGAILVELWTLSSHHQTLTRPPGGYWIDPSFLLLPHPPLLGSAIVHAADVAIGESLPGILFHDLGNTLLSTTKSTSRRRVHWRQLEGMSHDPFLQRDPDERMESLVEMGIGYVGAVPFSSSSSSSQQPLSGLVLFYSRSTVDVDLMRSESNERYLVACGDFIGAAWALRGPRMECSRIRREVFRSAVMKVREAIRKERRKTLKSLLGDAEEALGRGEITLSILEEEWEIGQLMEDEEKEQKKKRAENEEEEQKQKKKDAWKKWEWDNSTNQKELMIDWIRYTKSRLKRRIYNSIRKWMGAGLHRPPRQPLFECLCIFLRVFLVMMTLLMVNHSMPHDSWSYDAGWYSGSLCILFSLTAAPVGQPRQILLAHVWNGLVGYAIQQIPTHKFADVWESDKVPLFWKQSLSVALGVAGQAYFGFIHPPATGLSFSFASPKMFGMKDLAMILLGDLVLISSAVFILNWDETKQYPLFWFGSSWYKRKEDDGYCQYLSHWRVRGKEEERAK